MRAWEAGRPELSLAVSLSDFLPHCFPLTIPAVVGDGTCTDPLLALLLPAPSVSWSPFTHMVTRFFLHRLFYFLLESYSVQSWVAILNLH